MAKNKMKGIVEVHLGGASRRIKFDLNAICDLESHFDKPAHEIYSEGVGVKIIRDTLWVGLQRYQDGVKINEVGDWIEEAVEEGRFAEVAEKIGEALSFALSGMSTTEAESAAGKNPEPPKEGAKKKGKK